MTAAGVSATSLATSDTAPRRLALAAAVAIALLVVSAQPTAADTAAASVTRAPVFAFQAAGDIGGGDLTSGETFPPTRHALATLKRTDGEIEVGIHTDGLPDGAYTVWWIVFNLPSACQGPCDVGDLFNAAAEASVFYATGGIVRGNGVGNFHGHHQIGGSRGEPGVQDIINGGAIDPQRAEIHNVIKYHGPASTDPATLQAQLTTVNGSCHQGANAVDLGAPFGVQCFDPQAVVHPTPHAD